MDISFLQNLWFILMIVILFIYALLDGFDMGIGLILPFYKSNDDRKNIIKIIYPFWDGNELWLIIGTTVFLAISPLSFSVLLSTFYLGFMFIFIAFTCRAGSFVFLYFDIDKRNKIWQIVFCLSSFTATICGMVTLGNLVLGMPLSENREFLGSFLILVNPYSLITGLFGVTIFIMHGLSYIITKTNGELKERTLKYAKFFYWFYLFLFFVFLTCTFIYIPDASGKLFFYIGAAIVLIGIITLIVLLKKFSEKIIFFVSSLCIAGFWIMIAGLLFPDIVKASNNKSLTLTIYNSSSSFATLKYMAIFAVIGIILIICYTVFVYRVFKGKVKS
jgi:cytochrome bd ubiquinol oxidase subunit II